MKNFILLGLSIYLLSQTVGAVDEYPHYFMNDSKVSGKKNNMQLLHSGIASLQKRIDLIRKAKSRISLEYFIWEEDKAGLLLMHELIKRAKEGIDVRIIVDKSITVIEMDEFFSEAVAKYGIKLWHYQRALDPATAQYRTHRKILVIDGNEGITGGRNIGDDYFDFDEVYNFFDRDIYVEGPLAKAMEDSFDLFWEDHIVKPAVKFKTNPGSNRLFRDRRNRDRYNRFREDSFSKQRKAASDWIEGREGMDELADRVESIARPILNKYPILNCPKGTFVSDKPGANYLTGIRDDYEDKYKITRKVLFDYLLNKSGPEIWLASPYFMLNEAWQEMLSKVMNERKVKVNLYTNSLGSTDAVYVAANFYGIVYSWQAAGLVPYIHDSKFYPIDPVLNAAVEATRWGMHEKTQIFSEDSFYVGSYNIDNRSDFYNVELGIVCEGSKELTADLLDSVKARASKAYIITGKEQAIDPNGKPADVYGGATDGLIKIMKGFSPLFKWLEPLM